MVFFGESCDVARVAITNHPYEDLPESAS